jgi:hypothetical protein
MNLTGKNNTNPVPLHGWPYGERLSPEQVLHRLGVDGSSPDRLAATLPFAGGDATCGTENELQAVVVGPRDSVDLPMTIETSNYFQNILKRHRRGELPRRLVSDLEKWLDNNPSQVWENSWVRLAWRRLSPLARAELDRDLKADKGDGQSALRGDVDRFILEGPGEKQVRIPVSYVLKLALVDVLGSQEELPTLVLETGRRLAEHFLSDNTSPETYSFHLSSTTEQAGLGRSAAEETARRFLLTQLLVHYANRQFGLEEAGQTVQVYFAPHPPVRQKELNDCLSDSFYRELFMNPCLSGWPRGEEKHAYMHLCHQVLSRARLNSIGRLKEAGLVNSNLVVLPSTSNISLANNGTHVSLGSRRLSQALQDPSSFNPAHEKYLGDLVIKFVEHFLPLFVGTYSAAPYRLDFADFHPEQILSFLPYQLDYTHLRMIWRRWKKKAQLKARPFGFRLTPFGPPWLDSALSGLLGLKGDIVPDFRLIDYLVAVMSTDQCPALDGYLGNMDHLKKDLAQMGVFDPRMPVYLPYRQRIFADRGFAGFEGRHYSLFDSLLHDLGPAVELEALVTALAFRLIAAGRLQHSDIPDCPEIESERRQIFFGAAIGLPTFYIRTDTGNILLREILKRTAGLRLSRRYPGYWRVRQRQFRPALAGFIRDEAADLIEVMGLKETMDDLDLRLEFPEAGVHGRLTRRTLERLGARDPMGVRAREFNRAAEESYRLDLRARYLLEAWEVLESDLAGRTFRPTGLDPAFREALDRVAGTRDPVEFAKNAKNEFLNRTISGRDLNTLINLMILNIGRLTRQPRPQQGDHDYGFDDASIHRSVHG